MNFSGGTTDSDSSNNIIISDVCGNSINFHLNVDISEGYPFVSDGNVVVQMGKDRISSINRAEHFARAINNNPIISGKPDLFLTAIKDGSKVTLSQNYTGIQGNNINITLDSSGTPNIIQSVSPFAGGADPIDISQNITLLISYKFRL